MERVRVAVIGAGEFGRRHMRVLKASPGAELSGVYDSDPARASAAAEEFGCRAFGELAAVAQSSDAAVVAVPTTAHADVGCRLLSEGIHVLVEKPIAADPESAGLLIRAARESGKVLQVGHLERFNPAVAALENIVRLPLFFEIHRLNVFSPRSLDVDVVLDLMIHDLEIVLALTGSMPEDVRASGISILSPKIDIANVRLSFSGGCVANLTASRVSTERVRKLRLFQPAQYISVDYGRQDVLIASVRNGQVGMELMAVTKDEPLRLEIEAFLDSVRTGSRPRVGGEEAVRALEVSMVILGKIKEHAAIVARSVGRYAERSER